MYCAVGDVFSCHAVDNPDMQSEMSMLQQYGPHVPEETLRRLVLAFGELRTMADQGLITYPYSTREVVSMVKHLEVGYVVDIVIKYNSLTSSCHCSLKLAAVCLQ